MKFSLRTIVTVMITFAAVAIAQSCFRQNSEKKDALPKIDRAQLCRDGGAAVNEVTNECSCATGLVWNGVRCDVVHSSAPVTPAETPVAKVPAPAPAPVIVETKPQPIPASGGSSPVPDWLPELIRACRIGNGSWLKNHQYCHCPDGKVLMGRRCRPMSGRMMNDVCQRAVKKGEWMNGVCVCPAGQSFSPGLGGCVDAPVSDKTILRRICGSSMNQGRWNEKTSSCTCPAGKMLVDETCVSKSKLTSATVCTSPVNGGEWEPSTKSCSCPDGKIWINQACLGVGLVDAETACLSELNRGTWIKKKGQCGCPGQQRWIASKKICIPR